MKAGLLYRSCSFLWRNTFLKWHRDRQAAKVRKYWEEHKKRNGSRDGDKTFYVIRRRDLYCGLFSLFLTVLARIDEALKKGYIPVVDLQNDFNIYLDEDKIGKENAWEYFFKQPCGYGLNDIAHSRNVIIGSGAVPEMFPYLEVCFLTGQDGKIGYWKELAKKYIKLSDQAVKCVEKEYYRLFCPEDKVLGILCRGTDYLAGRPKGHPIQPTPEEVLREARRIYSEQECTRIFLATEDENYYRILKENFGDDLITNRSKFLKYQGGSVGKEQYESGADARSSGMEYLITIMLLARCHCLCAGCASATVAAMLLTEGYEYTYLFDLGIYE